MVLLPLAEKTTGMSQDSTKTKELTSSSFTVDDGESYGSEMPGVTRLLNRKSFVKTKGSAPAPAETPATQASAPAPVAPASIDQDGATVIAPAATTPSIVVAETTQKTRKRRSEGASKPLVEWTRADLQSGSDPLGKAICSLLDSGVSQTLFLGIQAAPGSPTPVFVASAAVNAGAKAGVWFGLRWDPAILPEIWNQLVTVGYVELPPPGTMTNLHSARNVSRSAFDVAPEECLVLARVGTAQMCRGILALISRKSLIASVKQAQALLNAAPTPTKKSA
jgi:hypothetical protein